MQPQWYSWPTVASFEAWHAGACEILGMPRPGMNASTGEVDEGAQWTTGYTAPFEVAVNDVRAIVEANVAEMVPDGLGVPCDAPPAGDD